MVQTRLHEPGTGTGHRMTTPAPPADSADSSSISDRPPMPSIAASALLESRMLIERTRRTVADWLARFA